MMDGAEFNRLKRYARAKTQPIKTTEKKSGRRGGEGVEGFHFDDDNDDDEDDKHNLISLFKRIRDNELREKVEEWRRNVC